MTDIRLKCDCGKVQGVAKNITPSNGNRVVCFCDSCQDFANHLANPEATLDEFGGTEIFQTSQSQVVIEQGAEHLRALKLQPKGLVRWYTGCCRTPIANTMNSKMPFVGVIHRFMDNAEQRETDLGPVRAYVQAQHALKTPTYPGCSDKFPLGITFRIIGKMLSWKIRGMHKPSAFFADDGRAIVKPEVLEQSQK